MASVSLDSNPDGLIIKGYLSFYSEFGATVATLRSNNSIYLLVGRNEASRRRVLFDVFLRASTGTAALSPFAAVWL